MTSDSKCVEIFILPQTCRYVFQLNSYDYSTGRRSENLSAISHKKSNYKLQLQQQAKLCKHSGVIFEC